MRACGAAAEWRTLRATGTGSAPSNVPSNFVGTTKDSTLYQRPEFGTNYRYQIQDTGHGIDVNREIPGNDFWDEFEVAYPGGIPREYIVGAQKIGGDGASLGKYIPNPHVVANDRGVKGR